MKKKLFYSAVAIAMLSMSGCSNEATIEQEGQEGNKTNAIGFKSFLDKNTKATPTSPGSLKQDFWVYAYFDNIGDHSTTGLTPNFMYDQHVIHNGSGFSYTPVKYWPESGDVEFYAYTPRTTTQITFTNPTLATSKGYPAFKYKVNSSILAQEDLLVAAIEDQDGLSGSVNLNFNHSLTKVGFSARTAGDYASQGVTVKVKSITMSNIINEGAFSYENYVNVADTARWWTADSDKKTSYAPGIVNSGGVTIGFYPNNTYLQVNASDQFLLMIPQNFTGSNSQMTIVYDILYRDGTATEEFTKVIDLNGTISWTAGTYVNYALTISLKMVTFTASVSDWNNKQQDIIILPEDDE